MISSAEMTRNQLFSTRGQSPGGERRGEGTKRRRERLEMEGVHDVVPTLLGAKNQLDQLADRAVSAGNRRHKVGRLANVDASIGRRGSQSDVPQRRQIR